MIRIMLLAFLILLVKEVNGQETKVKKHENVIYGMISGMALLMDVYEPEHGNGIGVIYIPGSGFGLWQVYQRVYNQLPLKDDYFLDKDYSGKWAQELVNKGYTVFVINHRFSPRFHFPDGLEDCRRAVRFIRYNAKQFNIDPNHIGAMGHSSGGYLAAMLGVYDQVYLNVDKSPIDSVSSKVQAVTTLAANLILSDINQMGEPDVEMYLHRVQATLNYMGELPEHKDGQYVSSGKYAGASPVDHISKGDAAFLIYSSDNDPIAPQRQATTMYNKLKEAGVESKLVIDPKSGHAPKPDMNEVDKWFKKYFK